MVGFPVSRKESKKRRSPFDEMPKCATASIIGPENHLQPLVEPCFRYQSRQAMAPSLLFIVLVLAALCGASAQTCGGSGSPITNPKILKNLIPGRSWVLCNGTGPQEGFPRSYYGERRLTCDFAPL